MAHKKIKSNSISKVFILSLLFLFLIQPISVLAQTNDFDARRQAWLDRYGADKNGDYDTWLHAGYSFIFAWLEQGIYEDPTSHHVGSVHDMIHEMETHDNSAGTTCGIHLLRLLLQYGDVLKGTECPNGHCYPYPSDYDFIYDMFHKKVQTDYGIVSRMGGVGSDHSTQPQRTTEAYLFTSVFEPSAEFSLTDRYESWTAPLSGNVYIVGNDYNTKQFTENLLLNGMDNWVKEGNGEFDGSYTHLILHSMILLYDFSPDPVMKQRAKMVLDFMLLEEGLEYSGGQRGGTMGRTRKFAYLSNDYLMDEFYALVGFEPDRGWSRTGNFFVTTYRPPDLIFKIIRTDLENSNYWHMQKENNSVAGTSGAGKWTYVTPLYNLCSDPKWQVTIKTTDDRDGHNIMKFWIDKLETSGDEDEGEYYEAGDGEVYQYKNAFLLDTHSTHFHVVQSSNFDAGQSNLEAQSYENDYYLHSGWNFFREGDVGLAVLMNPSRGYSAVELAIIGVDYSTFDAFRQAVDSNSFVDASTFTTSKGDVIAIESSGMTVNGQRVNNYTSNRMETVYGYGNSQTGNLVSWNNNIMTLSKDGEICTYNFQDIFNWQLTGCESTGGPGCSCTSWTDQGCGANSCPSNQMSQTRTCVPAACAVESACVQVQACDIPCDPPCSQFEYCYVDQATGAATCYERNADMNCDTKVDIYDFAILLSWWNSSTFNYQNYSTSSYFQECAIALSNNSHHHIPDLNQDDFVNSTDLGILLSQWNQ